MGKGKKGGKRLTKKQLTEKLLNLFQSHPDEVLSFKDIFHMLHLDTHPLKMLAIDVMEEMAWDDYLMKIADNKYQLNTKGQLLEGTFIRKTNGKNAVKPDNDETPIFVSERNKFVSVIYKCLIFMFIEYHNDLNIREFLLSNFNEVFKNILSIPVGIMVEPYVKQVQYNLGNSYYFNVNDVSFLTTVARHPRFNVKEAILVLDVLGKILFDIGKEENVFQSEALKTNVYRGIYFYKIVDNLFMMILSRFLMHEVGIQFIFKYVKMILETYCRLDKDLSEKIYLNALILNVNPEEEKKKLIFEEDIILNDDVKNNRINFISLEKMIIVMMIQDILNINNTFINNVIKSLLLICCLQHFKIYNFHNIGLSKMLSHFGEPNDIVYYYNVNRDEYDIDKEFEIIIKQIYDKLPEVKEKEFNTESDNSKRTITNNTSRKKKYLFKKRFECINKI